MNNCCIKCQSPCFIPTKRFASPVPDLVDTNGVPSEAEAIMVWETLLEAEQEITRVETEIERTKKLLAHLLAEQQKLNLYVAAHKSVVSSIRHLPPEIMADIFIHALPTPDAAVPHPLCAPLIFTQVCLWWRDIALSTPRLWSSIRLDLTPRSLRRSVGLVKMYMDRSKHCPLYLNFQCRSGSLDCKPMLDIVIPHSARWQNINFRLPMMAHAALAPVRESLSSLQSIELACVTQNETEIDALGLYELAPELKEVVLTYPFSQSFLALPWTQLTRWQSAKPSVEQCTDVIRRAPYLRECVFKHVDLRDFSGAMKAPQPHFYLASLDLTVDAGVTHGLAGLFSALALPALRSLRVVQTNPLSSILWQCSSFPEFLTRSPHLERLALDVSITREDLVQYLAHVPSLRELHVTTSPRAVRSVDDDLIRALAARADATCLVPRLKSIRLVGNVLVSPQALLALITSRWDADPAAPPVAPGVVRLESLHAGFSVSHPTPADVEVLYTGLKPLRDRGLAVSVAWRGRDLW